MRIIGGIARGTKLYTLEGNNTRPTLDRVRESLFNIIQNDVIDSEFLDLFSGSGAIGLEAISRGAKKVILCDRSKEASDIIKKNIEKTHCENKVELYNIDFKSLLENKIKHQLDIIYLDPPYDTNYASQALDIILEKQLLKDESIVIIETDQKEKILNEIGKKEVEIYDIRKYGRAYLIFIKRKG